MLDTLPFPGLSNVPDYIECKPDIAKTDKLEQLQVTVTDSLIFMDRLLPPTQCKFVENPEFFKSYFLNMHKAVKVFNVHNYKGARIPLQHNNINVDNFRGYLTKFGYTHIHILQYVEFGFPLGLWSDAFLVPNTKNHSSAYSYHTYVDKFVESEIGKVGLSGPFERSPWDNIMLSPLMTSHKKPSSRRPVFDASFGMFSLNKNTPEKAYHETEYEFHFPKIDNLADIIASLGPGCYLFKRDLSRFFLQLKIDPIEYDRLGFVWRGLVFFFVSFVWGCRHAGYCGQWVTSAVSYIHAHLGVEMTEQLFNILNYADDFAGAEAKYERAKLSFDTLGQLLSDIGLNESTSKASPPSTTMTYLGVKFDTTTLTMHVDDDKVKELKFELARWSKKTVAKKHELQSILGKLLWVSRTVRFSRIFVSRIICEVRKLPSQSSKTTLSPEVRKDFIWWDKYIELFSGVEIIPPTTVCQSVLGDAYPQGGGSWNPVANEYFSMRFPEYMCSPDTPIHIKEFIIVILCIRLWGKHWTGQRIIIYCDNDSVCDTCEYQKPSDQGMQKLLREFLFWVCRFNFFPILHKISTKDNHIADFISRNHNVDDINKYFSSNGFPSQSKAEIPLDWYSFVAEW